MLNWSCFDVAGLEHALYFLVKMAAYVWGKQAGISLLPAISSIERGFINGLIVLNSPEPNIQRLVAFSLTLRWQECQNYSTPRPYPFSFPSQTIDLGDKSDRLGRCIDRSTISWINCACNGIMIRSVRLRPVYIVSLDNGSHNIILSGAQP